MLKPLVEAAVALAVSYVRQVLQNGEAIAAGIFLCSAGAAFLRPGLTFSMRRAERGQRWPKATASAARSVVEGR